MPHPSVSVPSQPLRHSGLQTGSGIFSSAFAFGAGVTIGALLVGALWLRHASGQATGIGLGGSGMPPSLSVAFPLATTSLNTSAESCHSQNGSLTASLPQAPTATASSTSRLPEVSRWPEATVDGATRNASWATGILCAGALTAPGKFVPSKDAFAVYSWQQLAGVTDCPYRPWHNDSAADMKGCLANKTVLFVGDSLDHELYEKVCELLGGQSQQDAPLYGYFLCTTPGGTQLVHTLMCGSHEGPYFRTCYTHYYRHRGWNHTASSHLREMAGAMSARLRQPPSIISVHFGMWDLSTKWWLSQPEAALPADADPDHAAAAQAAAAAAAANWFDGYPEGWMATAARSLRLLRALFPAAAVVFRSIGPVVTERLRDGVTEDRLRPRYVQPMAAAAAALCAREGVPAVDFFGMMGGVPEAAYDGMHYDSAVMVAGYFNTLLSAVCPAPQGG